MFTFVICSTCMTCKDFDPKFNIPSPFLTIYYILVSTAIFVGFCVRCPSNKSNCWQFAGVL